MALSPGDRFDATQALRHVLARAVVWGMIDVNPAKLGVDNPLPRRREQRPFESWAELDAVAAHLSRRYRPMVIFAAATGLRPAEWLALEWRDVDLGARVVYVHRSFTKGRLKCPKTEASRRAVPLQTIALHAIERQPSRPDSRLVFPAGQGGYLDLHNFRDREWKPAQVAAGIEPLRRIYDLPRPVDQCRWLVFAGDVAVPPKHEKLTAQTTLDREREDVGVLVRVNAGDGFCAFELARE
jgi:integrase